VDGWVFKLCLCSGFCLGNLKQLVHQMSYIFLSFCLIDRCLLIFWFGCRWRGVTAFSSWCGRWQARAASSRLDWHRKHRRLVCLRTSFRHSNWGGGRKRPSKICLDSSARVMSHSGTCDNAWFGNCCAACCWRLRNSENNCRGEGSSWANRLWPSLATIFLASTNEMLRSSFTCCTRFSCFHFGQSFDMALWEPPQFTLCSGFVHTVLSCSGWPQRTHTGLPL